LNIGVICIFRPPGTLVPGALCFTVDVFFPFFYFFCHGISELLRPIAAKLHHMITIWVCFIMHSGGTPPKEVGCQKHEKFGGFQTTSDFDRKYLRNGTKSERELLTGDSSRVPGKKSGELWSTKYRELDVRLNPPKLHFRGTIFWPLGGAGPSNFNTHYRLTKVC